MANQRDIARENWGNAQKIRSDILAKLSDLTKERGTVNYTARFEETEQIMAEFRLACMRVIFHDFEYAVAKKVEHSLWQCHTFLNGEYRKALGRLNTPNQVVQRRKLDKLYRIFLKTSEQFYYVYIQQLSNRFSIPELEQIARKTKTQPIEQRDESVSPPVSLRALVLKSCQMTLVRLGDLTRYRCQLSDKFSKTTFTAALDYYGLANSLDPEDGSAHHQLAVLHQIPGQHFDIVYHFHRAIAVSRPHELALKNLEREFKSPETSSQTKKGPSKDQSPAMVTWFVRLHAFFSHGKHFTQQLELEEEVLHRFELALKNETPADKLLLKMILINIAAYDISTEKVKSSWTMEGSQSCQFLLRFNTRMMLVLFRVLDHALRDDTVAAVASKTGVKSGESCITFAPSLTKLLPLCRLYIAWSYVARADLVQYQEYLEHYIKDLYRLLADVLTSLNLYIDPTMDTVSSKYLLPEDTEAQGLRPLGDRRLPLFLQTEEQPDSNPPKRAKTRKPQQDVFGRQFNKDTETVWRIRDIVCCGAFLAGSAKFPIALTTRIEQGRNIETWVFTDGASAQPPSNETLLSQILVKLKFRDIKTGPEDFAEPETNNPPDEDPESHTIPSPENHPEVRVSLLNDDSSGKDKGKDLKKPSKNYPESDLSEDSEMINMVNKLLDPSDDVRPRSSQAQVDPSYGMHSSTANEIFGNIEVSPIQPSPVSRAIPSLPWDYFYTPTPHRPGSRDHTDLNSNGNNVPRSAAGQFSGFGSSSYLDTLGVPYQAQPNSLSPRINTSYLQNSPRPTTASPGLPRTDYGLDTLEDSRNAVLDSLRSALLVQHGLAPSSPSPSNFQNRTSMTPVGSMHPSEYGHTPNSYLSSPAGRPANLASLPNPLVQTSRGRPELGQFPPTISGNHFPATMRPINSGIETTSNIWGQASLGPRQQHSAWPHEHSTSASPAFSHPSSLITGTPGAAPAALPPVANAVACNDHYYNATTPFGRLGNGVNNGAEPTHFRNQLKTAIGSEIPYDQQVLQPAMMDGNRKPRPK